MNEEKAMCDDGFNENSARVACQELYGNPEYTRLE